MLLLAVLMVALGLGAVTVGVVGTRQAAVATPDVIDVALGLAEAPEEDAEAVQASLLYRVAEPVFAFGGSLVHRLSPRGRVDIIRRRIVLAGLEAEMTPERVLGFKAMGLLGGLLFGLLIHFGAVPLWIWAPGIGVAGFFVPDALLASRADSRQEAIGRALPEALDLLAITVEAGLGLEQALEVVSDNLEGPLGDELTRLLREIELGVSRRDALSSLRARVDVPELSAFIVALIQADQMGVAIAEVLKVQASQVRLKRRQRAREKAAKAPVKILFPVIFGVLPSLFVVTLGPAAISIVNNFINKQ